MSIDFNGGTRANPKIEMTDEIREFLKENYTCMTHVEMGKEFGVSHFKIQCWLKELNLVKPFQVHNGRRSSNRAGFFQWDKNIVTI